MAAAGATYALRFLAIALLALGFQSGARAQFSPGELSSAHQALEGSNNCTQCHEVGKEISGAKCFVCHEEIKASIDAKKGYHFSVSSEKCVTCHKDHLGRNAKTTLFDEKRFDHNLTGFALEGKHRTITCWDCHKASRVQSAALRKKHEEHPHPSYLGLGAACVTCHADPHHNQFGQDCATCHSAVGWRPVRNFDHGKTKYPLIGKHLQVACSKCHPGMLNRKPGERMEFKTASYADCTPCHVTPHVSKFAGATCASCHTPKEWAAAMAQPFDHRMTRYRLVAKHATLKCEQCHKLSPEKKFATAFLLPFKQCTDCHKDRHNGEFAQRYRNNCALCHTEEGYSPSTFTLAQHNASRFVLTGAHNATLCSACHRKTEGSVAPFHFANIKCEACHTDVHKGQFAKEMKGKSCDACHTTVRWSSTSFDHAKTAFPLLGKHGRIACVDCHTEARGLEAGRPRQFQKISGACASCHKDRHQGQFADAGTTRCEPCHRAEGWKPSIFNHETQSKFSLTGGHRTVPCASCHRNERAGDSTFVRFKPLATECVSCHKPGSLK